MLIGAHAIVYSQDADRDRAFLRDVLSLSNVDMGGGWLIFGLPPSEIAVHPGEKNGVHELYLMCADVEAFVYAMNDRGIECSDVQDQGWGLVTQLTLPGGGKLGVYEPRHARPPQGPASAKPATKPASKTKKAARKAPARKARVAAPRTKPKPKPKKGAPKARKRR